MNRIEKYFHEAFSHDIEFGSSSFGALEYFKGVVIEILRYFFDCIKGQAELRLSYIDIENVVLGNIYNTVQVILQHDTAIKALPTSLITKLIR